VEHKSVRRRGEEWKENNKESKKKKTPCGMQE
jgi:hypothetical protein